MKFEPVRGRGGPERPAVVLDPLVQRLVDASSTPPYLHQLGPADGRQALLEIQGHTFDDFGLDAEFRVAPVGPRGLVGFWLFRPTRPTGPVPVVVYLHGGRWMLGDARTHARMIGELATTSAAAFVVPEYTRTPEARYPVALEESYAVLTSVAEQADALGLDGRRLALAGDCAGATMAAALTMMAKQRGGPDIRAQLLYYPMTEPDSATPSRDQFDSGYLLTSEALDSYWHEYTDDAGELAEPTASPMRATTADLAGLPPALIVTAEADVVRDEGEQYARLLRQAGVPVIAARYLGTVHDFVSLIPLQDSPPTLAAIKQGGHFLREALADRR
ncbi:MULTISPECIES: alpha/beta hydrolase [unclassified Streptomyces]|uniref:alpha/beta hydrolase n=1 Tax=unclassified Streptomyces TaxID=2593676 RepID=UPI002E81FCB8|nr:alpha/beta hydrolase [Streptomyces sp. NBC_00589]WTI41991.1 alpha/beta hydrolase [Streptomyces sp. NBC_00775]WUB24326.1 alpha/beta hydrolase [Streptomyces sp. NBC_00589]